MLLLRGATTAPPRADHPFSGFNMLLLRGATCNQAGQPGRNKFQYMLLLRGATRRRVCSETLDNVSIHAPLARSNGVPDEAEFVGRVSIHAPLARSNFAAGRVTSDISESFNTCSSCEEQLFRGHFPASFSWFQYMLLLRGATGIANGVRGNGTFQYMLLLRGAT